MGLELKPWREAQGWTQEDAAYYLGTTQENVSRWERGTHGIPGSVIYLIRLLQDKKNRRIIEKSFPRP